MAPDGCVIKTSGVVPEMWEHSGTAKVFDTEIDCYHALNAGDLIEYDTISGYINLLVDEAELEKRKAAWKPLPPRVTTGYLAKYASMVGTASHGARVVAKL